MPVNNRPRGLGTAPISMPPALPPWPTMRFGPVYLADISARAEAAKSSKVLVFLSRLRSRYQPEPLSEPPLICATAPPQPRPTRASLLAVDASCVRDPS